MSLDIPFNRTISHYRIIEKVGGAYFVWSLARTFFFPSVGKLPQRFENGPDHFGELTVVHRVDSVPNQPISSRFPC